MTNRMEEDDTYECEIGKLENSLGCYLGNIEEQRTVQKVKLVRVTRDRTFNTAHVAVSHLFRETFRVGVRHLRELDCGSLCSLTCGVTLASLCVHGARSEYKL